MGNINNIVIPHNNKAVYELIYQIEVGLREFVIDTITRKFGPKSWKQRLPDDVLQKFREAQRLERSIRWLQFIPHHPLYYVDFPDLKKIITRRDNWNEIFQVYFKSSDVVLGTFAEMEPIRNKVAHNRVSTQQDVKLIQSAYSMFSSAVGNSKFSGYINQVSLADDLINRLKLLTQEVEICYNKMIVLEPINELGVWNSVSTTWWFDEDYFGMSVSYIKNFYDIVSEYKGLSRFRGSGHEIELWVNCHSITDLFTSTNEELKRLTSYTGE